MKAVVTPSDLAGTFAWSSSAGIRVVTPNAQSTAVQTTRTTASSALGLETLEVTFTPTGGPVCGGDAPHLMTVYDVQTRAEDGVSGAPRYVGATHVAKVKAIVVPAGVEGKFEEWSYTGDKVTLSYPPAGLLGKQVVEVWGGAAASEAVDAEAIQPRFRPAGGSQIHAFVPHNMTVLKLTLSVAGVAEDKKQVPGAGVAPNTDDDNRNGVQDKNETGTVAGENDLVALQISVLPSVNDGSVRLEMTTGAGKVAVWSTATKGQAVALPGEWRLPATVPATVYVEGLATSSSFADVEFRLSYENAEAGVAAGAMTDKVRFSVIGIQKNPLGSGTTLSGFVVGKVYVPSRYGGMLKLTGDVQLFYTDGADLQPSTAVQIAQDNLNSALVAQGNPCSYAVPNGRWGWFYIKRRQTSPGTVTSSFTETGKAARRPWNGWWWPTLDSVNPNAYDNGYALDKFDRVYGTKAQQWEAAGHSGGENWWGHCWGWSIASVLVPQPQAVTKNGVSFSRDDMEYMYTELLDRSPYYDASLSIFNMPATTPTYALGQDIDGYCDDLYRILRICIREDRVAVQTDLRARATPPNRVREVWNHAIHEYVATFVEAPGANDERLVRIFMEIWANNDNYPPPTDGTNDRYEWYEFDLDFDVQGRVIANSSRQNWTRAQYYPPMELVRLTGSSWIAKNPYVTKSRVDGLYQP